MHIRAGTEIDAPAIAEIYGHYVRTSCFTFEEAAPAAEEMAVRMKKILAAGHAYLVAEKDGAVMGYAYAAAFHTRSAYRFTVENSVYIAPGLARQGIGFALMRQLIADCTASGSRQMVARIGDSENSASIALHEKLGFIRAGELKRVGFKLNRWINVVLMQLALG